MSSMGRKKARRAAAAKKKTEALKRSPVEGVPWSSDAENIEPTVEEAEDDEEPATGLLKHLDRVCDRLVDLERHSQRMIEDITDVLKQQTLSCRPIGFIRSAYPEKTGTPRQGMLCPYVRAELTIEKNVFTNAQHSLDGLDGFSHIWLIFWFHLNRSTSVKARVKPPRLAGKESKGVFATRSPHRPNPLGLSLVRLDKIEGGKLYVTGVDLVDGTPVLDVKPFVDPYDVPVADDKSEKQSTNWVTQADSDPSVEKIEFTSLALKKMKLFHSRCASGCEHCLRYLDETQLLAAICELFKTDLRSRYRRDKCSDRIQIVVVDIIKVSVWYDDEDNVHVLNLEPRNLDYEASTEAESKSEESVNSEHGTENKQAPSNVES